MSDLINRADAIRTYQDMCNGVRCYECQAKEDDGTCKLEKWLKNLPSAERKGEWNHPCHYGLALPEHQCSECGYLEYADSESNYCPNCGADMRCEEDERLDNES